MHSRSCTHNRTSDLIRNSVRDSRGIYGRRYEILLIRPSYLEPSGDGLPTPLFYTVPAELAVVADIHHGLDAGAVTYLPVLYVLADPDGVRASACCSRRTARKVTEKGTNLNNNASSLMTRRADAKIVHVASHRQVFEHVVNIRHAQAGAIESDKETVGTSEDVSCGTHRKNIQSGANLAQEHLHLQLRDESQDLD